MSLIIKNIKKKFGNFVAVDDISLEVKEGEFVALLGPSGSGKTTLLRIIAGLELADEGEIYLEGIDATGKPIMERKIGFVFQHFALFKHMTVFENIAFGLRLKKPRLSEQEINEKVKLLLYFVHLDGMEQKYPSNLSGGQRQRVALARVLAIEPKYMLLDEPFGALDSKVRKELRRWLKKLHDSAGLTTIFVTHDQEEAMEMSDQIAIINQGKLIEMGSPMQLWQHPSNSFIYDFLGNYNTFYGHFENGKLKLNLQKKDQKFYSRPHETSLEKTASENESIEVKITFINQAGPYVKIELEDCNEEFYEVEIDKLTFKNLGITLKDYVWIKPFVYKEFHE